MTGNVGIRVSIDGDASGAKRAADEASASIAKLNDNAKNLPSFMGSGTSTGSSPMPRFNSPYVPPLTSPSPYGVNTFYDQMSPGGVLPDARRVQNTDQKIAQLTDQLTKLGETIKGVNQDIQEARENKEIGKEHQLSGTLQNLLGAEKHIKNELRSLEKETDRSDPGKAIGGYFAAHIATQLAQSTVAAGNTIIGSMKTLAGGDALGAAIQKEKGIGQIIGSGLGAALGAVVGSFVAPGAGTMAGAGIGATFGNFIGGLSGDKKEIEATYSEQYKKALPAMDMFYQRYGTDIETKSGKENSRESLLWYNRASQMAMGTGKTTDELMDTARNRGAYGNISAQEALTGARDDAMWERFTGANINNITRMAGLSLRYGSDEKAVQTAYAGLTANNMGKGQFDEFLTSMLRIMEDGIEKGFVKGADEIAGNMTFLSKLSGGDALWTGEQGANRLMRMNDAIFNATSLQTTQDVMVYSVARDLYGGDKDNFERLTGGKGVYTGTYVDEMQILERGVSKELLEGVFALVKKMESGNDAAQIEHLMKMLGLRSYTEGAKVLEMSKTEIKDWDKTIEEIKGFQQDIETKSDLTELTSLVTSIDTRLANMGKLSFDKLEIPSLAKAEEKLGQDLKKAVGETAYREMEIPELPPEVPLVTSTGSITEFRSLESLGQTIKRGDTFIEREAERKYDIHGEYGKKMGDLSVWLKDRYDAGEIGRSNMSASGFSLAGMEYSFLQNMTGHAVRDYTKPDSAGGEAITKAEFEEFIRRMEGAIGDLKAANKISLELDVGEWL